ncbi:uncharacterized protein Smp_203780 [Schistosoma mansoni]|uniref:Uncharacterized protein n=1 Tax=Schistosoma mansoni TaxID=6183 RepID=A0AA82MRD3_SCHMA|nr:uncharacterized protein Smp_203780 [Schistosoma mansoni]|eukprot:XP_018655131.1 uncharacterized protein Smp_203780 [Schistosoma mansoni]
MSKDKADDVLRHFIKHTEKSNVRRSVIVQATNRKVSKIALVAFGFAFASYFYSLYAIKRNRELGTSFDQLPPYTSSE